MKKKKPDLTRVYRGLLHMTTQPSPVKVFHGDLSPAQAEALFFSLNGIQWDKLYNKYGLELQRKTKTFYEGDPTAADHYMNAYGDKGAQPLLFSQAPQELQDLRKKLQAKYGLPFSLCYINYYIAVRLKVEENQLVDVFGEIGFHIDGLKGA